MWKLTLGKQAIKHRNRVGFGLSDTDWDAIQFLCRYHFLETRFSKGDFLGLPLIWVSFLKLLRVSKIFGGSARSLPPTYGKLPSFSPFKYQQNSWLRSPFFNFIVTYFFLGANHPKNER
jgi:hypothetical protein